MSEIKIVHNKNGAAHQLPDTIIVHSMGEYVLQDDRKTYLHAPDFLDKSGLSAHALVSPDGTIYRCRNDDEGAYHARGFNSNSLGIEVLVKGRHDYDSFMSAIRKQYVSEFQYQAVLEQCLEWVHSFDISRIVRHSDVSPGRKYDPGSGFPWARLLNDIQRGK